MGRISHLHGRRSHANSLQTSHLPVLVGYPQSDGDGNHEWAFYFPLLLEEGKGTALSCPMFVATASN
jgi:hypothetical protein